MSSASALGSRDSSAFFPNRINSLMSTLARDYQLIRPQFGSEGFKERVFEKLTAISVERPQSLVSVDGKLDNQALDRLCVEQEEEGPIPFDIWLIYGACAFGLEAMRALEKGERDRAWDLLAEGFFYLGAVAWASKGEEMTDTAVKKRQNSERARKAAEARHKPTNEMKMWAYEYIRSQTGWPSQARAVAALENVLKEQFKDRVLTDYEGTITSWLEEMADREQHFPTVGNNRSRHRDTSC